MAGDFEDSVVVITGAGSGIGRATALAFGREGARVHAVDIDAGRLEQLRKELGDTAGSGTTHVVDCSDADEVQRLADDVYRAEGRVDVLHNNAGVAVGGPTDELSLDDWETVLDVNLRGVVYGVDAFLPRMLEQDPPGHVVNTASGLGLIPSPYLAPYVTSKFAVVGLTDALAIEYEEEDVHFTVLCPGLVNTNIVRDTEYRGDFKDRREESIDTFERHGVSPDDVAEGALRAVRKKRVIQITPLRHVMFPWLVRRVSTWLYRFLARRLSGRFRPAE